MSDEEIREVLDLGARDLEVGDPLDAEQIWGAGRRTRTRGHAWVAGLAAAAAAAVVASLAWGQGLGLGGGDATPADDATRTSEPPVDDGTEEPPDSGDLPLGTGTPAVIVLSEGGWDPSGELTPLTAEEADGRRWLPVDTDSDTPSVAPNQDGDWGLAMDGTTWRVRDCGIDIAVQGALEDGVLVTTGEPEVVPDPDPGAACVYPVSREEWTDILTGEPHLSTDGDLLVIRGGTGSAQLVPVGMALVPDGVEDPAGGPATAVTSEDLAGGLSEVPATEAESDVGVSDVTDPQPGHTTSLILADGFVSVDVGCAEPLRGPGWFSHIGPEEHTWQLTAALPDHPDCADGAASEDAELWRQLLAHGLVLHRFGDYVILDGWAVPSTPGQG